MTVAFWRVVLRWCDDDLVLAGVGTLDVFIILLCASCARTPTAYTSARSVTATRSLPRRPSFCLLLPFIFRVHVILFVLAFSFSAIPRPSLLCLTSSQFLPASITYSEMINHSSTLWINPFAFKTWTVVSTEIAWQKLWIEYQVLKRLIHILYLGQRQYISFKNHSLRNVCVKHLLATRRSHNRTQYNSELSLI